MSPTDETVHLRPATPLDADLLLTWANDPTTRAASFRTEQIDPVVHRAWLRERLASPTSRLYIGYQGADPIGQVRLERQAGEGAVEISISIARDRRGRGLGSALLAAGLEAGRRDAGLGGLIFIARVRTDNEASIKLFERAGFRLRDRASCRGVPCLVFERRP